MNTLLLLAFLLPPVVEPPMPQPANRLSTDCQLLVQPDSMALTRSLLRSGKLPLGRWHGIIYCPGAGARISRGQVKMAVPEVRFLDREIALPVLLDRAGGKWRKIAHYGMLAAMLAPGGISAATISTHAVKWIGAGLASVEILRKDLEGMTPDVRALSIEIPETMDVPAGGSVEFSTWGDKMAKARNYGPIRLETK